MAVHVDPSMTTSQPIKRKWTLARIIDIDIRRVSSASIATPLRLFCVREKEEGFCRKAASSGVLKPVS